MEKPSEEEIKDAIDEALMNPAKFRSMTYTDGVKYALEWVLGEGEHPMED